MYRRCAQRAAARDLSGLDSATDFGRAGVMRVTLTLQSHGFR